MMHSRSCAVLMIAAGAICLAAATGLRPVQPRYVISGRVDDPHRLRPANIMLMVGYERDGVGVAYPVTIAANGTFATNTLLPAKYVLTLVRDPYSPNRKSTPIGFTIAEIVNADLTGVNVEIRPDVTVAGRFRMEPGTPWPSSIVVTSCLGEEGLRLAACQVAEGAPDGKFLLRNAFGPRVLQVGWSAPPAQRHNKPKVLFDGNDVTDIPTDFSANPSADLQVVFSRGLQLPLTAAAKTAINAPSERIGRTYQSLVAIFSGRVRQFDVKAFQNPHADIPGAQYAVDYGGIIITFFSYPSSSDILVTAIDVTDMKWLATLGVTLEGNRSEIESRLGRPLRSDFATLHYEDEEGSDIGPATLTLSFRDNRLVRATWTFPWD